MVPYAGWDMPVEYSGISNEHLAVRTRAGVFDVSHMGEIEIAGKNALAAVQLISSNDASVLQTGQAQYAALTTPDGTFVDDMLVYRMAPSHFMLVVNAANTAKAFAWISEQIKTVGDVAAIDSSSRYALIAVQGPAAGEVLQPLVFFAIITTLFPLAITPELAQLRIVAPGVVWVSALLSSMLALEFLYRDDAHDGTLEQYALSGQSLTWLLFAKTASHWLLTGLPLAVMAPLAALSLGVPAASVPGIIASIALGSIALSLVGAIGASLTLGVRRSGVQRIGGLSASVTITMPVALTTGP